MVADDVVRENSRCVGTRPGLYLEDRTAQQSATLLHQADLTLVENSPKWLGKKIRFDGVRRISPTSKTAAAQFNIRTYGTVIAMPLPEIPLRQMKVDLLVDDTHPPLSIRSTKAISSAEMGSYSAAGGTIVAGQIESMITRFISISDSAAIMVPRGIVLAGSSERPMLDQLAVRVDVDPSWMQHDLGIYRIPGK